MLLGEGINAMAHEINNLMEMVNKRSRQLLIANRKLENYSETLEQKVEKRTEELNTSLAEVERTNKKLMDSIQYAERIQRSLLPNPNEIKDRMPKCFVMWVPRDVVGGDAYFTDFFENSYVICLFDCTGHGVPGALMTMMAYSGLRKIVRDEGCREPAEILKRLNHFIKTSLRQDTEYSLSNDGLDAAICLIDLEKNQMRFSGAMLSMVYVQEDRSHILQGDRESIGYRRSNLKHDFKTHQIEWNESTTFYLFTDGYIDQIGGERQWGFGRRRFVDLLGQISREPFEKQLDLLREQFNTFKGENETRDDITVIGFQLTR